MKLKNHTTLFLVFIATTLYAQDPNIIWQRTIGGSGSDKLWSIIETSDGGFFVGGDSDSNISGEKDENSRGGDDYWILRLDSNGNILWQKTYGGSAEEMLCSVQQTSDGGFILGGFSNSDISGDKSEESQGGYDYWIIKLNSSGDIVWQNTIGGSGDDNIKSIIETNDEGFLLGGNSTSPISGDRTVFQNGSRDLWLIKLDSTGAIVWQKAFGHNQVTITGLAKTNDGGFILSSTIFGITGTHDAFWVLKIDAFGNYIWDKIIQGDNSDWFPKISSTQDGGYIMAGASDSDAFGDKSENSQGSFDYWVLKLDENGDITWQNTIGGSEAEQPDSIIQSVDGGYLVSGYSSSNISGDKTEPSNNGDYWIIKLNNIGIIEWQNTIGGGNSDARARTIQTSDENYVIGGYSSSNISGDKTENSRGNYDFWIIKHAQILGLDENSLFSNTTLYPNPAKNTLQLNAENQQIDRVKIFSVKGDLVQQVEGFETSKTIDVSKLASGMYYVQFMAGRQIATKKFVKQ